jgi:hypothetical protein
VLTAFRLWTFAEFSAYTDSTGRTAAGACDNAVPNTRAMASVWPGSYDIL